MKNLTKEFNAYLSNLSVFTMKLHNIHWNVEGATFPSVHEYTDSQYNAFFERLDVVAELFKVFGEMPVSTLKEQLELATIVEEPTRKFSCQESLEVILKDFELLRDQATELRHACDQAGWFTSVAVLEEHVADYSKNIWFLKATLA